MSNAVSEAAAFLAERGLIEKGAPPVVRMIMAIASRFSVVVSEEVAAKSIPVVGSAAVRWPSRFARRYGRVRNVTSSLLCPKIFTAGTRQ